MADVDRTEFEKLTTAILDHLKSNALAFVYGQVAYRAAIALAESGDGLRFDDKSIPGMLQGILYKS